MSSYFIPAFLMAILHILSSFFFVDLSNIRVLGYFMTQQQKKFILAYQLLGNTVSETSRLWTVVNETNRTYPNSVAKIQVYMSNKTQNSNYFSLLRKLGSYNNMLNFMAIVYILIKFCVLIHSPATSIQKSDNA